METNRKSRSANRRNVRRLMLDTSGNMMMIMALAFIPVTAMVGSAFDMGRLYMVKTRLQQACDAGALAGRRAMTTDKLEGFALDQANEFFKNNFTETQFGTTGRAWEFDETEDGQVEGTASATVPMTIMKLFQKPAVTLNVACEAILEVANNDIMFVLDVTGSMNCAVGGSGDCGGTEQSNSKIAALRGAVVSFYTTLDTAMGDDSRLRIGFVPYSTGVNVGGSLSSQHLVASAWYQSRERRKTGEDTSSSQSSWTGPNWPAYSATYTVSSDPTTTSGNCNGTNYPLPNPNPQTIYGPESSAAPVVSSPHPDTGAVTTTTHMTRTATNREWRRQYRNGKCVREYRERSRTETSDQSVTVTPKYTWDYKRIEVPAETLAKFKAKQTTELPVENNPVSSTGPARMGQFVWDGCIEEGTDNSIGIDKVPSSESSRWTPAWKEIIWRRTPSGSARPNPGTATNGTRLRDAGDRNAYVCPKAARKLDVLTLDQVRTYVNATTIIDFKGAGYTYHDTGLVWGGRFISPDGIFSSENTEVPSGQVGAGKPINRHIIFMTDGDMSPEDEAYGLYGIERLDGRIGNGTTDTTALKGLHYTRFSAICEAIKAKNITIWVVAYAQSMTPELKKCASPGKDFYAANDAQLKQQFEAIASKIAELRISK